MTDSKNFAPNMRAYFGAGAGVCYSVGNVVMTFKGVVETAFRDNALDLSSITDEPVSATVGGLFLVSSLIMSVAGNNKRGMATAMGLGAAGYAILSGDMVAAGRSVWSMVGAGLGFAAASFGVYQNVQHETPKQGAPKKESQYPMAVPGLVNFASNTAFFAGALADGEPILAAVGTAWMTGSALLTASKPQ
jgi:hypothetical protein